MISAIELKKYVTGTGILSIVIGKLCYKKKPYSIILLEDNKSSEVGFYYTILPFNLAIRLWVEGNREFLLDIKEIA